MKNLIAILMLACISTACAAAKDQTSVKDQTPAQVAKLLGIDASDVHESPVPGMYEVQKEHQFGYVTKDGQYLIQGELVNLKTGEQITEEHRKSDRLNALSKLGSDELITYAPPPPIKSRYVVTVFTDVTCPFCRKMHSDMAEYNKRGITIRYAFYPRSGPDTAAFREAESVWCSKDRHAALDSAFADAGDGDAIPQNHTSCKNPILREYKLGRELGLRGTPMLILPDGEKVDGYLVPKDLAAHLDEVNKANSNAKTAG